MGTKIIQFSRALTILLIISLFPINGVTQTIRNFPSPEVANLGLYGQIPVSHFTGVPDISVPLYEIKIGDFSMPISANYHIASVKPNIVPGPLGLGWNLMAGGYITRNIRGFCDEYINKKGEKAGLYYHTSELKEVSKNHSKFDNHTENFVGTKEHYELSADEFSFNFCGYVGNFYLNEDGGWTVVSDQDIKVEFDSEKDGFIEEKYFKQRFQNFSVGKDSYDPDKKDKDTVNVYDKWKSEDRKIVRFFNKFTLITPDGSRYEFGGKNAIEFSIPYYERKKSHLDATTWRLTKITTPDKRIITLEYSPLSQFCEFQRINQSDTLRSVVKKSLFFPAESSVYYMDNKNTNFAFTGILTFPVLLKKITTPNEIINFRYKRDPDFGFMFLPNNGLCEVLYHNNSDIFSREPEPNEELLYLLMNFDLKEVGSLTHKRENNIYVAIANSFLYYYLTAIQTRSTKTGGIQEVRFEYETDNRRKLSKIIMDEEQRIFYFKKRVDQDNGRWHFNYPIYKDTIIYTDMLIDKSFEYNFTYNKKMKMPKKFIVGETDYYGYYTGREISPTIPSVNEYSTLWGSEAEVLTEIKFPTGGKTCFEYELNDYSRMVSSDFSMTYHSASNAGGLRVAKITNFDRNNQIVGIKKYYYSKTRGGKSSGISKGLPERTIGYKIIENGVTKTKKGYSKGGYDTPITNSNTPYIGYSWVIEDTQDENGNSLGFIRYHYSNYDTETDRDTPFDGSVDCDIDTEQKCHFDEPALYSYHTDIITTSQRNAYTSTSFERGKLLSKEYFDKDGILQKAETYQYERTPNKPILSAYQEYIQLYGIQKYGWLNNIHTASYVPVSMTELFRSSNGQKIQYKKRTLKYNSHKLLERETTTMSDGSDEETTYKYSFDYPEYNWMAHANITLPVVEKKITAGGLTHKETNYYGRVSDSTIPYIQKRVTSIGDVCKTEYEVFRVDEYGNPVEMMIDGICNVLCWGHQGQRLLARVENSTFAMLKYALHLSPDTKAIDYAQVLNARSLLPMAQFHLYQYNDNYLFLESETMPNGMTTFYNYDHFGRLTEVYYIDSKTGDKKVLKAYGYHYYSQKQMPKLFFLV